MIPIDIIDFFKNLFNKTTATRYNGIAPDTRSPEAKAQDWNAEEIIATGSIIPIFRTVTKNSWKHYSPRNQGASGACVAHSIAKMLEICRAIKKGDSIKLSASPIYKERSNKPAIGMTSKDAFSIAIRTGTCRESVMLSELLSDPEIDALPYPTNYEKLNDEVLPTSYVTLPISFDYVAGIVEREGCAMLWVNTDSKSWNRDTPTVGGQKGGVLHSVVAVDTFTYKGAQYILIEDSWGKFDNLDRQRLLSREFFDEAVFYAATFLTFKFDSDTDQHFAPFDTDLEYGHSSNEIIRLQDFLRSRGFFPKNTNSTGYYGNITAKSVYNYQIANNVAPLAELQALAGRRVGPRTRSKMNEK